eukprot:scaffold124572_cov27-Tisochrysis_lutea.AAC.6
MPVAPATSLARIPARSGASRGPVPAVELWLHSSGACPEDKGAVDAMKPPTALGGTTPLLSVGAYYRPAWAESAAGCARNQGGGVTHIPVEMAPNTRGWPTSPAVSSSTQSAETSSKQP